MEPRAATTLAFHGLLVLNLLLQIFDGLATYVGFAVWGEGNPLLRVAIDRLGLGPALLVAKSVGCALLVFIWASGTGRIALAAMSICALVVGACSLVPWLDCFWAELKA